MSETSTAVRNVRRGEEQGDGPGGGGGTGGSGSGGSGDDGRRVFGDRDRRGSVLQGALGPGIASAFMAGGSGRQSDPFMDAMEKAFFSGLGKSSSMMKTAGLLWATLGYLSRNGHLRRGADNNRTIHPQPSPIIIQQVLVVIRSADAQEVAGALGAEAEKRSDLSPEAKAAIADPENVGRILEGVTARDVDQMLRNVGRQERLLGRLEGMWQASRQNMPGLQGAEDFGDAWQAAQGGTWDPDTAPLDELNAVWASSIASIDPQADVVRRRVERSVRNRQPAMYEAYRRHLLIEATATSNPNLESERLNRLAAFDAALPYAGESQPVGDYWQRQTANPDLLSSLDPHHLQDMIDAIHLHAARGAKISGEAGERLDESMGQLRGRNPAVADRYFELRAEGKSPAEAMNKLRDEIDNDAHPMDPNAQLGAKDMTGEWRVSDARSEEARRDAADPTRVETTAQREEREQQVHQRAAETEERQRRSGLGPELGPEEGRQMDQAMYGLRGSENALERQTAERYFDLRTNEGYTPAQAAHQVSGEREQLGRDAVRVAPERPREAAEDRRASAPAAEDRRAAAPADEPKVTVQTGRERASAAAEDIKSARTSGNEVQLYSALDHPRGLPETPEEKQAATAKLGKYQAARHRERTQTEHRVAAA
ncbi:hypothetical protein [Marinitenerispora sediminis]|uniref:Uncharacterized protein n=1 Tax=Marinitenerispora sediminis TaxID=1931232 RepID=A0A368T1G8_9ACTN|nr:hypothetical protein [Marinitenerispora sediminis]RCV50976.1 hypothetical protein DEF23_21225 [Marinitenerispora sediminis]RCV53230.1 hypothetical protein DEF28_10835 [Marinitenerispora sediminis]RCV54375.1 hypothetical protein DEF24_19340 [Marinitenerispora sediminis]